MAAEPRKRCPKKKRRKTSTKQKAAQLAIEARREKAAQLKLAGWTDREIAAHLGVSLGTANTDINAVLERLQESAEDAIARQRRLALARLEKSIKGIWPGIEAGDLATVDTLVKVEQRRARLLGLDAPTKVESEVTNLTLDDLDQLKRSAKANECSPETLPSKSEPKGSSS